MRKIYSLPPLLPLLFLVATPALHAGDSIDLSIGSGTASVPLRSLTQSFHIDFQISSWTLPASTKQLTYDGGWGVQVTLSTTSLLIGNTTGEAPSGSCSLDLSGRTNINVRVTRDYPNLQFICDFWNNDGSGYERDIIPITAPATPTLAYIEFGASGATAKLGFYRQVLGLPADYLFPATTYTSETTYAWWKFDGSLADSSGNGKTVTWTGTPTYSTTPDQVAAAIARTYGAPFWSTWLTQKAGFNGQMDGTASFSMADASNTVTYKWNQTAGPSTVLWSSTTTGQPLMSGLVFGPYTIRLVVTDVNGSTSTATLDIGAVAQDSNGVVIQGNPDVDKIFGPMITWGQNPWGYQDYEAMNATQLRSAAYTDLYGVPPRWQSWETGTVNYKRQGTSQPTITLNGAITSSATTIVVNDASVFDWSVMPTVIQSGVYTVAERIRICNRVGNTLTVCFDGRGWANTVATAWGNGAAFYQTKITGSGTSFLSTVCPAGIGPAAAIYYNTGTVTATAGSATLEGAGGTAWSSSLLSRPIMISGTYSTGTPFRFISTVLSVTDADTLVMARVFPAGADTAAGLTYWVLGGAYYIAPEWTHPTIPTGGASPLVSSTLMLGAVCESDTAVYTELWLEAWGSATETNMRYALVTGVWPSDFGISYYDEALAHQALYLRSGGAYALTAAQKLTNYWPWYPGFAGGVTTGKPRQASIISSFAAASIPELGGNTSNWPILRGFASAGQYIASTNNCLDNEREASYTMAWAALGALFDPDPAFNAQWVTAVQQAYTRDNLCKGTGYEFPQYIFPDSPSATGLTATNGSAIITGSGLTSALCHGAIAGTVTLTNGSTTATLASGGPWQSGKLLSIWAARPDGSPWFVVLYTWGGGATITFPVPYEGTSGTYQFQMSTPEPTEYYHRNFLNTALGKLNDPHMQQVYSCIYDSPTQIILDRAWDGASVAGTLSMGALNLLGIGQQPFMLGIKAMQMSYGNQTNSNYQPLLDGAANYIYTSGWNPQTLGLYYGSGFAMCEPEWDALVNCGYNSASTFSTSESRIVTGEAQNAARVLYDADPTVANKLKLDKAYGAIWGDADYNSGGVYYDSINAIQDTGINFANYKWTGFLFGVGMSHQWPAARLGGVAPPDTATIPITCALPTAKYPTVAKQKVLVKLPTGVVEEYVSTCASPTMNITIDHRYNGGWYLRKIQHLTAGNVVVTSSDYQKAIAIAAR